MKEKVLYTSPEIEVIKIKLEGSVLVGSPDLSIVLGDPFANTPDEVDW